MTKQARRDEDDEGGQDDTTPSNEIGKTSTTPRPLTAGGTDARRSHIFPRPKGQGMSGPIKASTTTRRRHPPSTANHTPGTVHPMTQEAENGPDHEKAPRAVFASSQHKHVRPDTMTPQPKEGGEQDKLARTRRREEPRRGSGHHRRKCPSEATECDLRAYI